MVRRGLLLVVGLVALMPCIVGCSSKEEGGSSTVVKTGTGSPPPESPPEPGRARPQVTNVGGAKTGAK